MSTTKPRYCPECGRAIYYGLYCSNACADLDAAKPETPSNFAGSTGERFAETVVFAAQHEAPAYNLDGVAFVTCSGCGKHKGYYPASRWHECPACFAETAVERVDDRELAADHDDYLDGRV